MSPLPGADAPAWGCRWACSQKSDLQRIVSQAQGIEPGSFWRKMNPKPRSHAPGLRVICVSGLAWKPKPQLSLFTVQSPKIRTKTVNLRAVA